MFKMELKTMTPLNDIKLDMYDVREYDDELDDERSVIADICEVFANTNRIRFIVSGFGSSHWPVDCRFDLPIIIEQLPEIKKKIDKDDFNFSLNFYEQGIEREINFTQDKDNIILECISRNNWVPEPSIIAMGKEDISRIFNMLYENFKSFSTSICKDLSTNHLLKAWMSI